jgi:HD-like signal output (HDOD) protein
MEDIIARFKKGEVSLPSHPRIYIKFKEMVDKSADLQSIAELLKNDAAISFKLISVANSAYYRGLTEIKNLDQAIGRLGFDTTKRYVDAISNRNLYITTNKKFKEFVDRLWEHSLSCAFASEIIAKETGLRLEEDPFTVGLMHDIGNLILLQVAGELEQKGQLGEDFDQAEFLNDLKTYHTTFGPVLLKRWKFPDEYARVAQFHDAPANADSPSECLMVVHLANLLVKSMGYSITEESVDVENAESLKSLKLDPAVIPRVRDSVKTCMENIGKILT